jgi:carboxypeptidase Taq
MHHDLAAAPQVADFIADAENEDLNDEQAIAVAEFKRSYRNRICLSSEFVKRQTEQRLRCEQLWRQLRADNNWADFLPALDGVVTTMREEAQLRADALKLSPYDALIEQYDPGSRVADIAPVFETLKRFLTGFIPTVVEKQAKLKRKPLKGPYDVATQKALGQEVMRALGFDFNHGRLDVSHHPFCGGVPSDVRMTTRYRNDEFLSALMGIMHETGHGLYEQNLPAAWQHWPSGAARGMAMHESQSLFAEKQIGRNPAFWQHGVPLLKRHFGAAQFKGWRADDFLRHVLVVKPGLIRVDADEVTYPMHIILRFELEQELVSGALRTADIPEAWDTKMKASLGLSTAGNYKDGPMQDVHWPAGAFGYFPSYTLGAMMAAQQWVAIVREHPDANDDVARGDFSALNAWRKRHIWSRASMASTPDLMRQATGEPLNAAYFIEHLKQRYG